MLYTEKYLGFSLNYSKHNLLTLNGMTFLATHIFTTVWNKQKACLYNEIKF